VTDVRISNSHLHTLSIISEISTYYYTDRVELNCRHAAALALVGWFLMVPPDFTGRPHSIDSAAPISRWTIVTSFNSADICKKALTELQNKNGDPAKLDATGQLRRFQRRQPADPELAHARVDNAACIATDDPGSRKSRMNSRRTAALALMAWYLIAPRHSDEPSAPISTWSHFPGTFDSYEKCKMTLISTSERSAG
jgi:hypothetical protein